MSYKLHAKTVSGSGRNRSESTRSVGGAKTLDEAREKAKHAVESEGADCVAVAIVDESGAEVEKVEREEEGGE